VRLTFDPQDLAAAEKRDDVNLVDMRGVLWDTRVGSYRPPLPPCARRLDEVRTRGSASRTRRPDRPAAGRACHHAGVPGLSDGGETASQWAGAGPFVYKFDQAPLH